MNSRISKTIALAMIIALGPVIADAAETTGTPVLGPAGHYYEVVAAPGIPWATANGDTSATTYLGSAGHLATITSFAEDDFINTLRLASGSAQDGSFVNSELWVGGLQTTCTPEPGCGWEWVNGEGPIPGIRPFPASPYQNWDSGEPNDVGGGESRLAVGILNNFVWNDEGNLSGIHGYVIEYDNVPPVAVDDSAFANSGETINIDVLDNDNLPSHAVTSINVTTPDEGGTATVVGTAPNLSVDYTSAAGFGATETFDYTITFSNSFVSNTATVTIEVDGTVSVTPAGDDIVVFGGPANGVPLFTAVELAQNAGQSSVRCCTVRDPRVGAGNAKDGPTAFKWQPFDIGAAMSTPLADADCAALPQPDPGELIIARHFGVHTDDPDSLDPADFRFGLCVVETDVSWLGPAHLDVDAGLVVGYPVKCKVGQGVDKQPLTLGLTTFPVEFASPKMRAVTVECDPRSIARWSTWYFVPNAQHLTGKESSKTYVGRMSSKVKGMIEAMRAEGAVADSLLNDVKSLVLDAEKLFKGGNATAAGAALAMPILDMATVAVLNEAPAAPAYPGSASFTNPKGELGSHLMALRYAVCSELAFPNMLANCTIDPAVDLLLPALPTP